MILWLPASRPDSADVVWSDRSALDVSVEIAARYFDQALPDAHCRWSVPALDHGAQVGFGGDVVFRVASRIVNVIHVATR